MSMITPHQLDLYSSNMAHFYNAIEGEILRKIIDALNDGTGITDVESWRIEKLQQLRMFTADVVRVVSATTPYAENEVRRMFEEAVSGIIQDVDDNLPFKVDPVTQSHIDQVMEGYFKQNWSAVDNYVNQTLITTNFPRNAAAQAYTDVLNRTSALFNTGVYNFGESLEKSIIELAEKGIGSSFIDKGGHRWSLERYVGTVMKSTLNNTYNEVKTARMQEFGQHTVLVTAHMGAREKCSVIQGEVVDLREPGELPANSKYYSVHDPIWGAEYGTKGGHRGINCGHDWIPFTDGVNVNNQPKYDEEENRRVAENRDRQRAIERQLVRYKKRLMVAEELGLDSADKHRTKIKQWDKAMNDHLDVNGDYLSRNRVRETVYTPLKDLVNDAALYVR